MANEYQVIARKWRPQRFADMVGQEHIVATLKNAIRQQRTAHAYLFVGSRGIGKTTSARIFAKALNCEAPEDGEPCCKCKSCISIASESNIDVIEIDAASQNSVDNIRELRDEVMHVPVSSRYKIYIIDEVHMLSKQAWNALLKTVEEPPKHAKFIFATTEVHMVLPTIISRCQRFDLQRISTRLIAERLMMIASSEGVNITMPAVEAIARAADGGMRDAQSLLDQMIAFFGSGTNTEINEEQVLSLFGLTAASEIENLVVAIFKNDKGAVIANVFALASRGKNLETLYSDLLAFLRGIELCQLLANPENVLECGTETIAMYQRLAQAVRQDVVQRLLETLSPVGRTLHDALNKQVYIETIILKAMRVAHSLKIDDLIGRLNQVRNGGELDGIKDIPAINLEALPKTVIPVTEVVKNVAPPIEPQPVSTPPVLETAPVSPSPQETQVQDIPSPEPAQAQKTEEQVVPSIENTAETQEPVEKIDENIEQSSTVNEIPATEPENEKPVVIDNSQAQEPIIENGSNEADDQLQAEIAAAFEEATIEEENQPSAVKTEEPVAIEEPIINELDEANVVYDVDPQIETPVPEKLMVEETIEEIKAAEELVPEQSEEAVKVDIPVSQPLNSDTLTPQNIWHEIIARTEKDKSFNPMHKHYMQEGTPESYENSVLTVYYDEEYEQVHAEELTRDINKINKLLMDVTGDWSGKVNIELKSGIKEFDKSESRKLLPDDLRKKAEGNEYVQGVIDLFGGEIVDVHG